MEDRISVEDFSFHGKPLRIGRLEKGKRNAITDVPGVRVGHCTLKENGYNTGVTVILPTMDSVFLRKVVAAYHVINGFGKTCGLMQIGELGTIETPIALTNTLNVGLVADALVSYTVAECEKEGVRVRSVNPVVGETNDAALNRISDRPVREEQVLSAIRSASSDFQEGAVGAGRGTTCFGFKGGIGSSSRTFLVGDTRYTVGILVQSNYGATRDLCVASHQVGEILARMIEGKECDKGSVMVVLATDLPVSSRQLGRLCRRVTAGLARTGSAFGTGSGDVVIGFTTANRVPEGSDYSVYHVELLREQLLDNAFRAVIEATEEAVLRSLLNAERVCGNGKSREPLAAYLGEALKRLWEEENAPGI